MPAFLTHKLKSGFAVVQGACGVGASLTLLCSSRGCCRRFWCICLSSPVNHFQVRASLPLIFLLVCSTSFLQAQRGCFDLCILHPCPVWLPPPGSALIRNAAISWEELAGACVRSPSHAGPHLPSASRNGPVLKSGDFRNTSGRLLLILNISLSS